MKFCNQCNKGLVRRRYENGVLEPLRNFEDRDFCDWDCRKAWRARANYLSANQRTRQELLNQWRAA